MRVRHNICTGSVTWLAGSYDRSDATGEIRNFYEPESIDELIGLCRDLYHEGSEFMVVGHTSNIYFRPSCNIENLVSTRRLNRWAMGDSHIECECGVNIARLARELTDGGVRGYSGLVDLPGTVGGGIYGNAGCYGSVMEDLVLSVTVLLPNGELAVMSQPSFGFSERSSSMKRKELPGVIVSARLRRIYGDKESLAIRAREARENRRRTQPGRSRNLGSVFVSGARYSAIGYLVMGISFLYSKLLNMSGTGEERIHDKMRMACGLLGVGRLASYLPYGWGRYMWTDTASHENFDKYVAAYKLLHKGARLEIEVMG